MACAIHIQSAELVYPTGTRALQPVSLAIAPGEFVSLLGPSGCGKSTLLKMIAGLLAPTQGRIVLDGRPPRVGARAMAMAQNVSFVFQDATLMPWADVRSNVRLPLDLAGVPRAQGDMRVMQALNQVGLAPFAAHRPAQLSGGMQMRVSIARGLVTQPSLLLMDEPFGALDEITRHRLDAELLGLWRARGLTVVFVTHSITEAVFLSSRVVVMGARPGRVVHEQAIEHSGPRDDVWRTSAAFNAQVWALQQVLAQASEAPQAGQFPPASGGQA